MKKPKLSIVILNHNTEDLLKNCLDSIFKYKDEVSLEVIVSDNASTDGSVSLIKNKYKQVKLTQGPNTSFSNGNNRARKMVTGEYVLLLNTDTLIHKNTFKKTVDYMDRHKDVGALTCKLVLADGSLDKDARRRLSTPWVSFKRLFLNDGNYYWYLDIPDNQTHEVDSIEGAFMLMPKKVIDKVGWLDEKYIFDGDDLDLCFQIRKAGYKIIYFGEASIVHLKKATRKKLTDIQISRKMEGVNSMERFYRKNLWSRYPTLFNYFVLAGIKLLKLLRYLSLKIKK